MFEPNKRMRDPRKKTELQNKRDAGIAPSAPGNHPSSTTMQPGKPEVSIGEDDRVQIVDTNRYPWCCICALRILARDGTRWRGTGWLAGPGTVITAGHVVYMHEQGGWVQSIEVLAGSNGSQKFSALATKATTFHSANGWLTNGDPEQDYGAITLPTAAPLGRNCGYFRYASLSTSVLDDLPVNLAGYPADKPPMTQWFHTRRIKRVNTHTFAYDIDTSGGQSGAPVWCVSDGRRYVVGIHTNGSEGGNFATRITSTVAEQIKRWVNRGS